jgi:protein tyrosine phosphatase (PTP) superfamily phosphohydrolase (DUF442 family)
MSHLYRFMFQLVLLLTVVAELTAAPAELPVVVLPSGAEIDRFSTLAAGIYRGGQPDEKGFLFLKQIGVKTVINLRTENDERDQVEELGMNSVHIPIRLIFPWSKVSESAVEKYFEVIDNPDNYPIFVHCRRGADRTGALSALYRIKKQGWSADKAWSEARDIGLHWWYRGLKSQVHEFLIGPSADSEALTPRESL